MASQCSGTHESIRQAPVYQTSVVYRYHDVGAMLGLFWLGCSLTALWAALFGLQVPSMTFVERADALRTRAAPCRPSVTSDIVVTFVTTHERPSVTSDIAAIISSSWACHFSRDQTCVIASATIELSRVGSPSRPSHLVVHTGPTNR